VRDDTENKKGKKNKRKDDDEITIKSLKKFECFLVKKIPFLQ